MIQLYSELNCRFPEEPYGAVELNTNLTAFYILYHPLSYMALIQSTPTEVGLATTEVSK